MTDSTNYPTLQESLHIPLASETTYRSPLTGNSDMALKTRDSIYRFQQESAALATIASLRTKIATNPLFAPELGSDTVARYKYKGKGLTIRIVTDDLGKARIHVVDNTNQGAGRRWFDYLCKRHSYCAYWHKPHTDDLDLLYGYTKANILDCAGALGVKISAELRDRCTRRLPSEIRSKRAIRLAKLVNYKSLVGEWVPAENLPETPELEE